MIKVNKLLRFFKNLFSGNTTNNNYDTHYQKLDIQPIDRMQRELTHEEFIGYLRGSIIKYDTRAGHKDGESYDKDKTKQKRYEYWLEEALKGHWINPRV